MTLDTTNICVAKMAPKSGYNRRVRVHDTVPVRADYPGDNIDWSAQVNNWPAVSKILDEFNEELTLATKFSISFGESNFRKFLAHPNIQIVKIRSGLKLWTKRTCFGTIRDPVSNEIQSLV